MIRRMLLTSATLLLTLTLHSAAKADTITLTGINGTGVTATITNYSLVGNQFTFTINNTSVGPAATGTITNIGFALPGNRLNNFAIVSASNTNYKVAYDLNATSGAQTLVSSFDLVLFDKVNGNPTFGGGSVSNGISGGSSATFAISGDFSGLTAQQIAQSIFARFQAVNGGGSDVAAGGPPTTTAVPEPATMLLFGSGLAGAAANLRNRRKAAKQ